MIELWYKIRLFTFIFNDDVDADLDSRLRMCLNVDIENVTLMQYDGCVEFSNGIKMNFWNRNKYYAWLSTGDFIYQNGSKYTWKNVRPTAKTMFKFKQAMKNMKPQIVIEHNPFNI